MPDQNLDERKRQAIEKVLSETPEPAWKQAYRDAKLATAAAGGAFALGLLLMSFNGGGGWNGLAEAGSLALVAGWALSVWSGARCLMALGSMSQTAGKVGWKAPLVTLGLGLMSAFGVMTALVGMMGMARGRQLRRRGKVLLPPVGPGGDWAGLDTRAELPEEVRGALAARWRENGRTEHASVAAFARVTLDLMALGAPPELIYAANADAKDEIWHAELCFSLARAIDGKEAGPAAFPEARAAHSLPANRTLALAKLAVDSLIDGALHEGLSARVLSRLARRCELKAARDLVHELAADEARHSAHGWDVVAWCLKEGGAPVAHALRGAAEAIPETPGSDLPPAAWNGAWERWGIHGRALELEEHRRCRAVVRRRVAAMTGQPALPALSSAA